MPQFLLQILVTALLLLVVARLVNGIDIEGFGTSLLAALVLGFVNAIVKPLMILLTLPLTILTFGLFLLVINALMLRLAAAVVPGFTVDRFSSAFYGSLLLTIFNILLVWVIGPVL